MYVSPVVKEKAILIISKISSRILFVSIFSNVRIQPHTSSLISFYVEWILCFELW